jgi:hypothetical protein
LRRLDALLVGYVHMANESNAGCRTASHPLRSHARVTIQKLVYHRAYTIYCQRLIQKLARILICTSLFPEIVTLAQKVVVVRNPEVVVKEIDYPVQLSCTTVVCQCRCEWNRSNNGNWID